MTRAIHRQLEIYGTDVWLCWNEQGWNEIRAKVTPPGPELEEWSKTGGHGETYDFEVDGQQHIVFRIPRAPGDGPAGMVGVIAHEAFHGAVGVCEKAGIHIDADNDEAGAYLAQWFADFLAKHLP